MGRRVGLKVTRGTSGVMNILIILILGMVSWIYTYVKDYQIIHSQHSGLKELKSTDWERQGWEMSKAFPQHAQGLRAMFSRQPSALAGCSWGSDVICILATWLVAARERAGDTIFFFFEHGDGITTNVPNNLCRISSESKCTFEEVLVGLGTYSVAIKTNWSTLTYKLVGGRAVT